MPINNEQVQIKSQKRNFFKDLSVIIKIQRLFRQRLSRKQKELNKIIQSKNTNNQIDSTLQTQRQVYKQNFFKDLSIIIKIQRLFRKKQLTKQKVLNLNMENKEPKTPIQNKQVQMDGQKTNFFSDLAIIIKIQRLFRKKQAKKQEEKNQKNQNKEQQFANLNKNMNNILNTNLSQEQAQKRNFFNDLSIIIKIQRLFRQRQSRKKQELIRQNQNDQQLENKTNNQVKKDGYKTNFFSDLAFIIKIQRLFRKRQAKILQNKNQNNQNNEQQNQPILNKNSKNITDSINKTGQKINFFKDLSIIIKIQRLFRQRQSRKKQELIMQTQNDQQLENKNNNQVKKDGYKTNFFSDLAIIIKIQRLFRKRQAKILQNITKNNQNNQQQQPIQQKLTILQNQNNDNKIPQKSKDQINQKNSFDLGHKEDQLTNFLKNLSVILKIQRLFRKKQAIKKKELNQNIQKEIKLNQQTEKVLENQQNTYLCQREQSNQIIKNNQTNLRSSDNQKQYTLLVRAPENEPTELEKQQQNQISLQNIQEFYYDFQVEESNNNSSKKQKQRSLNKNLTVPTQMKMLNEVYQNQTQQNDYDLSDDKLTYSQHLILNIQKNISSFSKQEENNDQIDEIVSKLVQSIDVQQDKGLQHTETQNNQQKEISQNLQLEKEKFVNQNNNQNYSIQKNFNQNKKVLDNSEQRNNQPSKFQGQLHTDQFDPEKNNSSKSFQNETFQQSQINQKDLALTAQFSNNSYYINQNLKQQLLFNFSQQKQQSDQSQQSNSIAPLSPNFPNKSSSEKIIQQSQQKNILFPKNEENLFKFLSDRIPQEQGQQLLLKDIEAQKKLIQRKVNISSTLPPVIGERCLKLSNERMPSIKELEIAQFKDKNSQDNQQNSSQLQIQSSSSNTDNKILVQSLKPKNEQMQVNQEDQGKESKLNKIETAYNNLNQGTKVIKDSKSANQEQQNLKDSIIQKDPRQ
ncbi:endo-1,4-beta-xylanase xylA, putative (macronuclear) [Tetrahymena thermophila SB210]|uniref:Endo-1,4-beta-xylanase xylA, putative n=1 Tax=Tetrahymena thermophila (strain SB210) TaxID=312017 RepID=Q22Y80_TETTS|nr:endo-1,4-beta-xylanase xylA, putative [Tetrahymena thermophila SB210]EAR90144.2 endo-1,4-beta-xylanase xylA, putative [Tetrahymena thermophila SB210]|eukprot:XP_001010389.2 endo-1,4-beta-xylanase xylA, putative [Tetrahymena thermophila SB210]